MTDKRITLFSGHYGSGKTNVAVNLAYLLKNRGDEVAIYDLDIVNPYFRTVDAEKELKKRDIKLVVSPYAETNVDIPAMNSESYRMVEDKTKKAVVDLGGDDRGALALGRFAERIKEENDYDFLLVFNCFRPETKDTEGVREIIREIESVAKLCFTGMVNNCNLGADTDEETFFKGLKIAKEVSKELSLPIIFSAAEKSLCEKVKYKVDTPVLSMELIKYGEW